ncbi:hypothetical protein BC628DRAFT_1039373 [Trametes gibbosa]|nr:hypothetical protein BC628DRAFT_1039373 [Trametes gibbosa]
MHLHWSDDAFQSWRSIRRRSNMRMLIHVRSVSLENRDTAPAISAGRHYLTTDYAMALATVSSVHYLQLIAINVLRRRYPMTSICSTLLCAEADEVSNTISQTLWYQAQIVVVWRRPALSTESIARALFEDMGELHLDNHGIDEQKSRSTSVSSLQLHLRFDAQFS